MNSILPQVPEFTSAELAGILESGEPLQIMDVRAPEQVALGRIDLIPDARFHNVRGSELINHRDREATGLDPALPVAVVCGAGKDSRVLASHLGRMGLDARSLAGGMADWMRLAVPRTLDPPESLDRLIQFDRIGSGCLGYLLVSDGEALIVDPPLFSGAYLREIEEAEARLVGVADTHVHADYVSGGISLARGFGVPYYLHPADAVYPYDGTPGRLDFHAVSDGDVIRFGRASLSVVHTPGHTEGSVTYLLGDRLALTGDFIFVGSIGRPDLGGKEEQWAGLLWESLARAKADWSPGALVLPAHYSSERERRNDGCVGAEMETLLEENEAMGYDNPESFIPWILSSTAPFPEAYKKIKALNVGLAPIMSSEVEELEVGRNECALGGVK
jgi:glyoxylase-like metal-dependent hydrolase (beta-lactamase superfamily II)